MSEKYRNFISECLSTLNEQGRISLHSETLGKLTNLHKGLQEVISSLHVKQEHRQLFAFMTEKLSPVKYLYCYCTDVPELHKFTLSMFPSLCNIKINMIPPSTIECIYSLKDQLQSVDIVNSGITDMYKTFAAGIDESFLARLPPMILSKEKTLIPEDYIWKELKVLKLSNCGLCRLDASFHLFQNITHLDLSCNQIAHVSHLHSCFSLRHVNLSRNNISVLSNLDRLLGNIISLNLSFNKIESLDGIDRMTTLQNFNVSNNRIVDIDEVNLLVKLPILESIDLYDNPIGQQLEGYRMVVYMAFLHDIASNTYNLNKELPSLDGRAPDYVEKLTLRSLVNERKNANSDINEQHTLSVDSFSPLDKDLQVPLPAPANFSRSNENIRNSSIEYISSTKSVSSVGSVSVGASPLFFEVKCNPFALAAWQEIRRANNCSSRKGLRKATVVHESFELLETGPFPSIEDIKNELIRKKSMIKPIESMINYNNALSSISSSNNDALPSSLPNGDPMLAAYIGSRLETSSSSSLASNLTSDMVLSPSKSIKTTTLPPTAPSGIECNSSAEFPSLTQAALEGRNSGGLFGNNSNNNIRSGGSNNNSYSAPPYPITENIHSVSHETSNNLRVISYDGVNPALSESQFKDIGRTSSDEIGADTNGILALHIQNYNNSSGNSNSSSSSSSSSGNNNNNNNSGNNNSSNNNSGTGNSSSNNSNSNSNSNSKLDVDNKTRTISEVSDIATPYLDERAISVASSKAANGGGGSRAPAAAALTSFDDEGMDFTMDDIYDSSGGLLESSMRVERPKSSDYTNDTDDDDDDDDARKAGRRFVIEYTGDAEYADLDILENLDLYFREQVFATSRPSGEVVFLQKYSDVYNLFEHPEQLIIDPPSRPEKFMALFVENIIDPSNKLLNKEKGEEKEKEQAVTMASSFVGSVMSMNLSMRSDGPPSFDDEAPPSVETPVLIVLSDCRLYFISISDIPPSAKFHEAYVPIVLKYHELYSLRSITINFGFQRCAFTFAETEGRLIDDAFCDCMNAQNDSSLDELTYFIITREKSSTYPMITKIPQIANAYRATLFNKKLKNVQIRNKDSELLGAVSHVAHELGADPDISHYQMLFRIFRDKPGISIPMTIILTPNLLILAEEDLSYNGIKMKIVDTSDVRSIFKIQSEDSPLLVTIIFKSTSVFSTKRKWRLKCSTKDASIKLIEEIRRACISNGVTDFIDS